jgi:NAD(P)H-hydrate epimerase
MPESLTLEQARAWLPPRPEDGHKGTFGHLFVLAGSRGFTGAAKLVCEAAGRSGVGLVTLGLPFPLADILAVSLTETMTLRLPSTESESFSHDAVEPALEFARGKQAVVLGPGLSRHAETEAFVHDFVVTCPVPLLIDADALNALNQNPGVLSERTAPTVLTPHPGEMAGLLGSSVAEVQSDREQAAQRLAQDTRAVVVLKGHRSLVADSDGGFRVNSTGNHGLGTGGAGDVLAGLLGGLLAQRMPAFEAACLGVWAHGRAGDIAAERMTARGMIASDVIAALPEVWRELEA